MIGMARIPIAPHTQPAQTAMDRRKALVNCKPPKQKEEAFAHQYRVDFTSILRIRPLSKTKEKDDHIVLEKAQTQHKNVAVAVMHPLMTQLLSPESKGRSSLDSGNFIHDGKGCDFHFHKILDVAASQDSVFYASGLSIASTAMEPLKKNNVQVKSTVVLAIGNSESGKTHTIFGKVGKSGGSEEGIVPRVLDSLYSQSKHHVSSKLSFAVRMQLLLVDKNEDIHDLFIEQVPSRVTRNGVRAMVASFEKESSDVSKITVEQDPVTNDFILEGSTSQICLSSAQGRELMIQGLQRSYSSRLANFGKGSSRGHVIITLQPVLITRTREIEKFGGSICMVDFLSNDKSKKSSRSGQMKDSISGDTTLSAVMHCFRIIKHNRYVTDGKTDCLNILGNDDASADGSDISCVSEPKLGSHIPSIKPVPWRQSKLTMLLQPMFSGTAPWLGDKHCRLSRPGPDDGVTNVTLLLNVYPGHRDYAEKRSLMNDLEILQGHELSQKVIRRAMTGLDKGIESCNEEEDYDTPLRSLQSPIEALKPSASIVFDSSGYFNTVLPTPSAPCDTSELDNLSQRKPAITGKDPPSREYIRSKLAPVIAATDSVALRPPLVQTRGNILPKMERKIKESKESMPKEAPMFPNTYPSISGKDKKSGVTPTEKQEKSSESLERNQRALTQIENIERVPNEGIHSYTSPGYSTEAMPGNENGKKSMKSKIPESVLLRLEELEEQNTRLIAQNQKLEDLCEILKNDNVMLKTQLREQQRHERQKEWTHQDEAAWRHSRQLRLAQQNLIQDALNKHLTQVENTYQVNNTWIESGKRHFPLDYPKWWRGAKDLDERDRRLEAMGTRGSPSPKDARISSPKPYVTRTYSVEKRNWKVKQPRMSLEQYKKLKKYAIK
jgi:Kinesin motor domain